MEHAQEREPLVGGAASDPAEASDNQFLKNASSAVRAGFIQKVYGVLFAQLLVTSVVAYPFVGVPSVKLWAQQQGFAMIVVCLVLNIAFLCTLSCRRDLARTVPTNYLLLFGFTATEGVLVGVICSVYTLNSILFAVAATSFLVGGLSCYAMYTKSDFTTMGPYLFAALLVLTIFGLFLAFFPIPFLQTVYCCIGILLFSFYLIYDTQLIMGKGELKLGIDDYILGALMLYVDIIQLFLYILQLFGNRS
jgi:hypothetical protein